MTASRFRSTILLLTGLLALAGCDEGLVPSGIEREVVVAPTEVTLSCGEAFQFESTVVGIADQVVTWSVDEGAGWGTFSETGLFTAAAGFPAIPVSGTFEKITRAPVVTVRATCRFHHLVTGEASVTFRHPDFALLDVNEASDTHGELVGPHDHAGVITGWYFGYAST